MEPMFFCRRRCLRSASSSFTWTTLESTTLGVRGNTEGDPPDISGPNFLLMEEPETGVRKFDGVRTAWGLFTELEVLIVVWRVEGLTDE